MANIISRADVSHSHEVALLFNEYRQFYGCKNDVLAAEQFICARLQDASSVVFMARSPEGMGLGFVQLYPSFSSLRLAPIFILNDVFVTQHARCVGIGRALVQQAAEYAKAQGARALVLETQKENVRAQGLYEALGFVRDQKFLTYELEIHSLLK